MLLEILYNPVELHLLYIYHFSFVRVCMFGKIYHVLMLDFKLIAAFISVYVSPPYAVFQLFASQV